MGIGRNGTNGSTSSHAALPKPRSIDLVPSLNDIPRKATFPDFGLWQGDVELFLDQLPKKPLFDLVVTSPPYNIGKPYEDPVELDAYLKWQKRIITKIHKRLSDHGAICWQVGNYVENGSIVPLDIEIAPIFKKLKMPLRNRIVWRYGHGLHCKRRFSGRYEVVLWYTKSKDDWVFNLDPVRVKSKYPGKRHFRGPNKGKYSGNPLGKNPEDVWDPPAPDDVWDIPNVKSNHIEKTSHPCQFPVGLIERLIMSLSNETEVVFDPFAGVGSAGVAAALHGRRFVGAEINGAYVRTARRRIADAVLGQAQYRPYNKPIYDHLTSPLSRRDPDLNATLLNTTVTNGAPQ